MRDGTFLADRVYAALRDEIVSLARPPRSRLDEAALARTYGVSRTPVREAIRRLAAEGFVELVPHLGSHVAPIAIENVKAYFECLRILSRAVLVLSAQRLTPEIIEAAEAEERALEEAAARRDAAGVRHGNVRLHAAIARATGNGFLIDAYERLLVQGMRLSSLTMKHYMATGWDSHLANLIQDHRDILAALGSGDMARLVALADRHVELFRTKVMAALVEDDRTGGDAAGMAAVGHLMTVP